jgi:thymidylate kinase
VHRRRGLTVALVGADGAGKSSLTQALEHADLPRPVTRIYMGVNLEASSLMLPTTRALLAVKRARGKRPDLVASPVSGDPADRPGSPGAQARRNAKNAARLVVWAMEEWLRQLVAFGYEARGWIVVFDRHFFADYYQVDVAPTSGARSTSSRVHGWMLRNLYPKPDLVLCLDAPGEVLYARKPEASIDWLEKRRQQYLGLAEAVPALIVLDATRPVDDVLRDAVETISSYWKGVSL